MAEIPLTLDTLKSPSNESLLSLQSPLMSPQCLKADSLSAINEMNTTTAERPSNLTIDSIHHQQRQQQQQHSNVTPSSSTTTLHGSISPALSSAGSLSPSFLPEMPQWKRDLIQRRKQNVQRTISASSPTSTSSSAASTTALTGGGLKTSISSSSSMRSLVGSNTNIDQLASDGVQVCSTKDYTKTSLLPFANTTTKVNKQYNTTNSTNTAKPATNIKSSTTLSSSPLKEKAEKLFGGQYTVTTSSSSSPSTTIATTLSAKEEIATHQQQQEQQQENLINKECKEKQIKENNKMMEENEEEYFEMYRKTKEVLNDETQTAATTTTAIITNKQQMATRLTGSTYNNTTTTNTIAASLSSPTSSSSSSCSSILKRAETEREKFFNTTTQQYHNISGANANLVNQSLNKCESERLVCAGNTTGNSNNFNNNTNNSVTIGGISVSGNIISNNQNNCSSSCTSVVKISQKLQENQFIKNEQQLNTKKIIKYKQNTITSGLDLKSPTKISHVLTTSNSTSCLTTSSSSSSLHSAATSSSTNCVIKKKMVAVQEMKKSTQNSATHLHPITSTWHATNRANNRGGGGGVDDGGDTDLDNSEDLSYGPGIVSKLRCRYLSLALRESMEQQRLNKDQLRRSTSLNNLLDNTEDEENCDEDDEQAEDIIDEDVENHSFDYKVIRKDLQNVASNNVQNKKTGILKTSVNNGQDKRFSHNSQGSNGVGVTFTETSYNKRSRHLKRGNDSLKRARSVEALLSEKSPWHTRANSSTPTCVTIEDKIHNARERLHQGSDHMPPKRLTSIIDDTERPPPDLVKQTLKMFEATANRRPRSTNRSNSKGDVAIKVETFKNIIKEQKPAVTFPKPVSPTKKLNASNLHKPLKNSTPQANDLLQSPLGRKTMAAAASVINTNDCLTPLKTNNSLSDHTPDIIPRQKLNTERDFKQKKEIFSSKEKFISQERDIESPLTNIKREYIKEKFDVDSPLTALSKELSKLKLSDASAIRKNDNNASVGSSDSHEPVNNVGSVGGVGGGDNNDGDACQRHNKYPYNNSNNDFVNEELINTSSLQNDKINNKTKSNSTNNEATSSSPSSTTTIEKKNEATVYNYDSSTKASSPPPSSSDLSDVGENYDDDEYGGLKTTKRITRTALDNIAKAGYTQQFKFNTTNQTNSSTATSTSAASNSSSSPLNTGKQIGVIRPLLNTQQQQQQKSAESNMESLKHSTITSLTSQEIEKNRINDLKKSSTTSATNAAATSSPLASLDHQMIKPSHTSSPVTPSAACANNAATSDVDSVISATNSPLWAMRKRRQTPPAAPAENTSMVFNFSNRKEVPDYIENDGVIFRRKRELPKPNESGFVLLGDLSVETSTDMDYDDFSMCPPSPCDVEFANANIVIDGKSSIRQKSKDITFRVQFNDTLTSTFEYPSEASLIVDESFSAYNESYAQPLDSSLSVDDFSLAFQNLNLANATTHHHVADEIIQLPTLNSSSPAATNTTTTNSPTKNILGNLPLDYPVLQKGIQLTTATTPQQTHLKTTQEHKEKLQLAAIDKKKSRKDLKLPLGVQPSLQKPPIPVKRFPMMNPAAAAGVPPKLLNFKSSPRNSKICDKVGKQQNKEIPIGKQQQQHVKAGAEDNKTGVSKAERKTPRVLKNPQYACFLQAATPNATKTIQRSRSNEFQKHFTTISVSAAVSRSNSLRNLEYVPANRASSQFNQSLAVGASSHCFSTEVNSNDYLNNVSKNEMAKNPSTFETLTPKFLDNAKENHSILKNTLDPNTFLEINQNSTEESNERSQSLNSLVENSQNILNLIKNVSNSLDNITFKENSVELKSFKNLEHEKNITGSLENVNDVTKAISNVSKTENKFSKNNTQNVHLMVMSDNPICMASLDFASYPAALPTKDARHKQQNLQDCLENSENLQKLPKKSHDASESIETEKKSDQYLSLIKPDKSFSCKYETKCPDNWNNSNSEGSLSNSILEHEKTLHLGNSAKSIENQIKYCYSNSEGLISNSSFNVIESSFGKISLTVNSKYVTDYRSKITENLPKREVKSMENLTSKNTFVLSETLELSKEPLSLPIYWNNLKECSTNIPENLLNKKSLNVLDEMDTQSKSHDNLAVKDFKLPTKKTSISNENFSDIIIDYCLNRNINSSNSVNNEPESRNEFENIQDCLMLTENLESITKSADNIVINDNSINLTDICLQYASEMNLEVNSNYLQAGTLNSSVDNNLTENSVKVPKSLKNELNIESNLETKYNDNALEIVEGSGAFQNSDNEQSVKSLKNFNSILYQEHEKNLIESLKNSNDITTTISNVSKTENQISRNTTENAHLMVTEGNPQCMASLDVIVNSISTNPVSLLTKDPRYKQENLQDCLKNSDVSESVEIEKRSLLMSRDSLDNFEVAKEVNEGKLLTDLEASEILEDIAIGLDTSYLFDFNKLLTLKKSKASYCLQSLENSTSMESEDNDNSLQTDDDDDDNFISACNTLESKYPLNPRETAIAKTEIDKTIEISQRQPPEMPAKKPKTLRIKTTEKILNLTNMASHNAATYATFRKSKNFYKNASKSFKNSLRFYETFSAKSTQTMTTTPQSSIKRSVSLSEKPIKKADLNRKIFSKSSKIMMKVRNMDEWDSPTENSYSFEYFDAEGDLNGNLADNDNDMTNSKGDNLEIEKNESIISGSQEPLVYDNLNDLDLNDQIILSKKSINLKPISSDFFLNASPRPFKRMYEATTVVNIEESSEKPATTEHFGENPTENFQENSSRLSLNIKSFAATEELVKENRNSINPNFVSSPATAKLANSTKIFKDLITAKDNLNNYQDPSDCFNKFSTICIPTMMEDLPIQHANSFTIFSKKPDLNNYFQKSGSFNSNSKNISQKVATYNKHIKQSKSLLNYDNRNNNSRKSLRNINNNTSPIFPNDSVNFENNYSPQVATTFSNKLFPSNKCLKVNVNSPLAEKSNSKVETFRRNDDSTEFSFDLIKFSANSPKFADSSSVTKNFKFEALTVNSFSENGSSSSCPTNLFNNSPIKGKLNNLPKNSTTLTENLNVGAISSNCLKYSKFDKQHTYINDTLATTSPTTTTLTVKDYNITTTTTPTTNFPTKVVEIKNAKPSNIFYTNSSCSFSSSVRTTNKSYTTAKYHQKQKATTIATTATTTKATFIPAPPLKSIATKNPPKVLPRRLLVNAPKTSTTKTSTTTTCDTTSSTTSSTYFKASSTCTSANNNVAPLRRRIPGNTLYYV